MRTISLTQGYDSGPGLEDREAASRPPDAAIRANVEIIRSSMEMAARMMGTPVQGLNIVVDGSNPGVPRAPEKISGQNGEILATAALAGGLTAGLESQEEPPAEETSAQVPAESPPTDPEKIAVPEEPPVESGEPVDPPPAKPEEKEPAPARGPKSEEDELFA